MIIGIRIHKDVEGGREAKELLIKALQDKASPTPLAQAHSKREQIRLGPEQQAAIASQFGPLDASDQNKLVSELIETARILRDKASSTATLAATSSQSLLDRIVEQTRRRHRPQQRQLTHHLSTAVERSLILLAEAPTGSGKTLAYCVSLIEGIIAKKTQVGVIAAPTLALMRQVAAELKTSLPLADLPDHAMAVVRGARQFVSHARLAEALAEPETTEATRLAVKGWIATQLVEDDWAWDVGTLAEHAPMLPPVHLTQSTAADDPGQLAYRLQFQKAKQAQIIVCSHAMLAMHTKLRRSNLKRLANAEGLDVSWAAFEKARKGGLVTSSYNTWVNEQLEGLNNDAEHGVLPAFDTLIIDEVHALESAVSSAMSNDVSLWSLLRDESLSKASQDALATAMATITSYGASLGHDELHVAHHAVLQSALSSISSTLAKSRKRSHQLNYALAVIRAGLNLLTVPGYKFVADFSPVMKYPRLRLGPHRVTNMLEFLWTLPSSALLLSATITLPRAGSLSFSDAYVRNMLALPPHTKLLTLQPAEWLASPVRCHFVPNGGLLPPSEDRRNGDHARWCELTANWLLDVVLPTAAGGTLVLCTSYSSVAAVAIHMKGVDLVVADRAIPITQQRMAFEQLSREPGRKPVWLAVGTAWTGLDLAASDLVPELDNLLTDLVIPRLPFRLDQSITQATRVERLGFYAEMSSMLLLLKQGIGRLVRREGIVDNRRLWILDARAADPSKAYHSPVAMLLAPYRRG